MLADAGMLRRMGDSKRDDSREWLLAAARARQALAADLRYKTTWVHQLAWALMPVYTFGFLGFGPSAWAAVRLRDKRLWVVSAVFLALQCTGFVLSAGAARHSTRSSLAGFFIIFVIAVSTGHAFVLRPRVFPKPVPGPVIPDRALQEALDDRARRERSREILANDPDLARDLRIGRTDLPHEYDDGGLVDLNTVTAATLTSQLGIDPAQAQRIVEGRTSLGGFQRVEDLVALTDLPVATFDAIKEHLIVLPQQP